LVYSFKRFSYVSIKITWIKKHTLHFADEGS